MIIWKIVDSHTPSTTIDVATSSDTATAEEVLEVWKGKSPYFRPEIEPVYVVKIAAYPDKKQ